ncbi:MULTISPECIES: hypothetical protein [Acidaminococcus]|uniref:hypothetical protein n=1 Tax=Acidaminococcus TaxID=904 RepID=UPI002593679B|nr:hypothetical protein [Acidaminococcus sp.]MDO5598105.1 hypothetical protein [Acidaminococcus sp.]
MQSNWKKTAVLALLAAVCAVPAYAEERPKLADGELFVNERIVKDGRVLYKALDLHDDWEHDPEKQVPGLVCTAFIPSKDEKVGPELASVKKLTTKQEKILAARRHYSGGDYANKLVLLAAMDTRGQNGKLDIVKAELFGRLLNVTVAIQDPTGVQADGSEALSEEHVITLPAKDLPRYGNLRVRFSDATGHALDDMDVALER